MSDIVDTQLRHLLERFRAVAKRKLSRLTDVYDGHEVEPGTDDNRAMTQCQTAGRTILGHITALRKALLDDGTGRAGAAAPDEIDAPELQAMIEDARDHV
ncbi:MAG TPA: hypothetical protein VKZ87_01065 [Ferrovibrio sp.]|jgi:hypothetical protein|uniref:hypothetical protein n=1 Tax=Ferrovibrio sp. TaxID=1917215 RepID=UPI002B4B5062|nr:hypothetical protein [Ferrovibrio sp.]HLT75947.1 hypothetical protein [Ferrovibrio sp.]